MAGSGQKKRLALDTNLLLDLARELDFAHDFCTVFVPEGHPRIAQRFNAGVLRLNDRKSRKDGRELA